MSLKDMTQAKWDAMTRDERVKLVSDVGLTKQLIGLEGWRVEVVDKFGEKRRFIVSRSTGWVPCHIEIKTKVSTGGMAADKEYASVKKVRKER